MRNTIYRMDIVITSKQSGNAEQLINISLIVRSITREIRISHSRNLAIHILYILVSNVAEKSP